MNVTVTATSINKPNMDLVIPAAKKFMQKMIEKKGVDWMLERGYIKCVESSNAQAGLPSQQA